MNDEQTIPTDTPRTDDTPVVEGNQEPTSLYAKTEAIVTRQEEANKKTEELLTRQETLYANQRLAGTTGGNVPIKTKEDTPEEYVKKVMSGDFDEKKE